ncbi:hypothetical protein V8Z80_08300 [Orrella sp. JC864]|uniref:hypothetical protein n=1 Tax=Orrella sp. JC864 TaxID=3120298 RepID=UPI00300B9EEF
MQSNNPIHVNDYREGYSYAVHCEKHGTGAAPWTVAVEVFRNDEQVLPRRSEDDRSHATYEQAKDAGVKLACQLIDQLISSSTR